jgi:hypothetical protein
MSDSQGLKELLLMRVTLSEKIQEYNRLGKASLNLRAALLNIEAAILLEEQIQKEFEEK